MCSLHNNGLGFITHSYCINRYFVVQWIYSPSVLLQLIPALKLGHHVRADGNDIAVSCLVLRLSSHTTTFCHCAGESLGTRLPCVSDSGALVGSHRKKIHNAVTPQEWMALKWSLLLSGVKKKRHFTNIRNWSLCWKRNVVPIKHGKVAH